MSEPSGPGSPPEVPAARRRVQPRREGRPRRRHGRVRRWVVRPFLWGLLVFLCLLTAVYFFFQSGFAHRRAVAFTVARLSQLLGRDVQVGHVDYDFAPLAFELHDVVIPGPLASDPAVARVPLVRIELSWRDLQQRILRLEQIYVDRPEIYIRFTPDGRTNLPQLRTAKGGKRRFQVQIGYLSVQGGSLQIDERRTPLDLEARAIWGLMAGGEAEGGKVRLDGHVTAQEVVTTLPNAKPYPVTVSARGSFVPGRIEIVSARLAGPEVQAKVAGTYEWSQGNRRLALRSTARGSFHLAALLGYVQQPIDGPFDFAGRFDLQGNSWSWSGQASSPRFVFENRVLTGIEAQLRGGPDRLDIGVQRARYADGSLQGGITVGYGKRSGTGPGKPVEVDLDFTGLAVRSLIRDQFPEDPVPDFLRPIAGRASGKLVYAFRSAAVLGGSGRVEARLQPGPAAAGDLPLSGRLPLTIRNGVVEGRNVQLAVPPAQTVSAGHFTLDLESGAARTDYRLASADLGGLAPLFPLEPGEEPLFWLPTSGRGTGQGTFEIDRGGFRIALGLDLQDVATPDLTAEAVRGSLVVRPEAVEDLQIEARKGAGTLRLAGRIPLEEKGKPSEPLTVTVAAGRWSAAEIVAFLKPDDPEFPDLSPVSGEVSGRVELAGRADALRGRAEFTVADFAAARGFAAESVRGSLSLRPDAIEDLRLEARQGEGVLRIAGRIPLEEKGAPPGRPSPPIALQVESDRWSAPSALALLRTFDLPEEGLGTPIEGTVSGRVDLTGPLEALTGRADLTLDSLAVAGNRIGRVEGAVTFDQGSIGVEQGLIRMPAGDVLVRGRLTRAAGGEIETVDFTADAPALSLAEEPLRGYLGGGLTGTASLAASVEGSLDRPRATVVLGGRDLALNGQLLEAPDEAGKKGEAEAMATWDGETLRASGSLAGLASFEGGGRLDRRGADLAIDVRSSQLGTLARLASPQVPEFEGSLVGTLGLTADFAAKRYQGVVRLADLRAKYQGRTIASREPVVLALSPESLEIRSLYLGEVGADAEVFVAGAVGLTGGKAPLDLKFTGTLPLFWAELAVPGLEVDGQLELLGTARGTVGEPALNGIGEIQAGRIILEGFPQALTNVRGSVLLNRDALVISEIEANLGNGKLTAAGEVSWPQEGKGLSYQLGLQARGISVRYPEGWLLRGNADLSLQPIEGGQLVRGVVNLDRAFYLEDVQVGAFDLLKKLFQRERIEVPETEGFLATTQLNLAIEGPGALQIRNNLANLRGDVLLSVRGSVAAPILFGQVEIDPGGTIVFNDSEYRIERGLLTFNNPNRIDPLIDLVARTEVRNFEITLNVAGTAYDPKLSFGSNSELADLEILSLLASGQELVRDPSAAPPRPGEEQDIGASSLLYGQAAAAVSQRVNTLFGFDRFRISPLPTETGQQVTGVSVTVGKRLTRDVFVTYTSNPSSNEEYVVQVEWRLGRGVTLLLTHTGRGSSGQGSFAVDAQWERRF